MFFYKEIALELNEIRNKQKQKISHGLTRNKTPLSEPDALATVALIP